MGHYISLNSRLAPLLVYIYIYIYISTFLGLEGSDILGGKYVYATPFDYLCGWVINHTKFTGQKIIHQILSTWGRCV